jgi:hypothetical protein
VAQINRIELVVIDSAYNYPIGIISTSLYIILIGDLNGVSAHWGKACELGLHSIQDYSSPSSQHPEPILTLSADFNNWPPKGARIRFCFRVCTFL